MVAQSLKSLSAPRLGIRFRQYVDLLARYLRPQAGLVTAVAVLLFTSIGLQLVNPQIIRFFIDEALAGSPVSRLIGAAALFTVIALAQQAVDVLTTYMGGRVGWTATNALRADLAKHCLSLDMSFHNDRTPGEMIERIDGDANELGGFFSTFVVNLLANALLLVGVLVLLFREDWRAGLALTVFTAAVMTVLARMRHMSVAHSKAERDASTDAFSFVEERLSGREETWANNAKPYVDRRFRELMRKWFRAELKAGLMTGIVYNTNAFMFRVGSAVALAVGAYLFLSGLATIGTVYLIFHYTSLLVAPFESMARQLNQLQRATASLIRIYELFQYQKTVLDGTESLSANEPFVRFERVSFSYGTGEVVLRDVSFDLRPGRLLGVIGRTGSGKTTLARLLVRLYDPVEGKILLDGRDLRDYGVTELRERIAMVTQDVRLFHGTIRDNLTFYDRGIKDEQLLRAFDRLGIIPWYQTQRDGLDTQLQSGGTGLSSGQAQLLALSRVFLKDPQVVVLDEPTSRLDRATEALIERALDQLVAGRTAMIIAHHLATVERCDDILVLEDGRVVEQGRPREPRGGLQQPLPPSASGRVGGTEGMNTWRFMWRLFLFNRWTLTLQVGTAIVSIVAIEHAVALAQREVFNTLTDDAGTSLGVWALCAILAALALGYSVTFLGDELLYRFNRFTLASLLRRNAFDHVLELRGNRSLPASPGEAVSRFRGDANEAVLYILDFDLLVANVLFFVVAIVIMVHISAVTAIAVFLPLVAISVIIHAMRSRIRWYRQAAREAAGGVTGFIGEMFGMIETIKVSNAESRVIDEFNRVNKERGRTSLRDEVLGESDECALFQRPLRWYRHPTRAAGEGDERGCPDCRRPVSSRLLPDAGSSLQPRDRRPLDRVQTRRGFGRPIAGTHARVDAGCAGRTNSELSLGTHAGDSAASESSGGSARRACRGGADLRLSGSGRGGTRRKLQARAGRIHRRDWPGWGRQDYAAENPGRLVAGATGKSELEWLSDR